jgi:hypothetical protein
MPRLTLVRMDDKEGIAAGLNLVAMFYLTPDGRVSPNKAKLRPILEELARNVMFEASSLSEEALSLFDPAIAVIIHLSRFTSMKTRRAIDDMAKVLALTAPLPKTDVDGFLRELRRDIEARKVRA